jgi:WD40 repeat protein
VTPAAFALCDATPAAFARSLSLLQHGDFDGGGVTSVAFSLSNSLLVSGGRDGRALVWGFDMDKKDLSLLATLQCGSKAVSGIAVCPDADGGYSCIWTSSLDNKVRRWDKVLLSLQVLFTVTLYIKHTNMFARGSATIVRHPSGPNPRSQRSRHWMAAPPRLRRRGCRSAGIRLGP